MIYVTRREVFSASHRLYNDKFSDEENERIFGKCNNLNGHGHNYEVEVTVCGSVDPDTGYVIDLKLLKRILQENIIQNLDHKNLNYDVDFLNGVIPTAENIAKKCWEQLKDKIPSGELYSIKIRETENNFVEYFGKGKI